MDLRKQLDKLESGTDATMIVVSAVIGTGLYGGLGLYAGNDKGDLFNELMKGALAVAAGCSTHRFGHWLFHGVAKLPPERRRTLTPVVLLGFIAIVSLSAYTLAAKFGQEVFSKAHIEQSLETQSKNKDTVVRGLRQFESLGPVAAHCGTEFTAMANDERRGAYSGFAASSGPLITYFEGLAGRCRSLIKPIEEAGEVTAVLVAKMDKAFVDQHAAGADDSKALKERVSTIRAGSEAFRSALVEASSKLPLNAVETLGKSFLGAQAEPALSAIPKVAAGQARGIEQARLVHERYGRQFLAKVEELTKLMGSPPPVFTLPSPAALPLLHWKSGLPIITLALALDGMIFALYLIAARMNDAIREMEARQGADAFETVREFVDAVTRLRIIFEDEPRGLGIHPFASATDARFNGAADRGGRRQPRPKANGSDTVNGEGGAP